MSFLPKNKGSLPPFSGRGLFDTITVPPLSSQTRSVLPPLWDIEVQAPEGTSWKGLNVRTGKDVHIVELPLVGFVVFYPEQGLGYDHHGVTYTKEQIEEGLKLKQSGRKIFATNPFASLTGPVVNNDINNNNIDSNSDDESHKGKKRQAPSKGFKNRKKQKEDDEPEPNPDHELTKYLPAFPVDPFAKDRDPMCQVVKKAEGKLSRVYTLPRTTKQDIVTRYKPHVMYASVGKKLPMNSKGRPMILKIESEMSDRIPIGKKKPSKSSVPVVTVFASIVHSFDPDAKAHYRTNNLKDIIKFIKEKDPSVVTTSQGPYNNIWVNTEEEGLVPLVRFYPPDCRERVMPQYKGDVSVTNSLAFVKAHSNSKRVKTKPAAKAKNARDDDQHASEDSDGEPKPRKTLLPGDEDYVGNFDSDVDESQQSIKAAFAAKALRTKQLEKLKTLRYVRRDTPLQVPAVHPDSTDEVDNSDEEKPDKEEEEREEGDDDDEDIEDDLQGDKEEASQDVEEEEEN